MMRRSLALVLPLLLAFGPNLSAQAVLETPVTTKVQLSDGPCVMWDGREATVYRVYGTKVEVERIKGAFDLAIPGLVAAPLHLSPNPPAPTKAIFDKPEKILAVSDVHGQFDILLHLLQAQKVVDKHLRWIYGRGHLVILGDVMDRGPQVMEAYWFLRGLEGAARRKGGQVHVLLGNHEFMVLSGDLRYNHPKDAAAPPEFPSMTEQCGPRSELGRWLRSRPTFVKLGPFLFVHGGPSPEFMALHLSLDQANENIRQALGAKSMPVESQETSLLGDRGPLWYRGLLPGGTWTQSTDEDLATILKTYRVRTLVVGHTPQDQVTAFHGGTVYGIDAKIKEGKPGEAWVWEKGHIWRGLADGRRVAVETGP